jgi:hypothetical protein
MTTISTSAAHGLAIARAAEAMLRTLGGVEVAVRFASPTTPSTADVGLAGSTINDVRLSPVVIRTTNSASRKRPGAQLNAVFVEWGAGDRLATNIAVEFLFPASAVTRASRVDGFSSPIDWFSHSLGIVFGDVLYPIASVTTENFAGQPYLYRITTR